VKEITDLSSAHHKDESTQSTHKNTHLFTHCPRHSFARGCFERGKWCFMCVIKTRGTTEPFCFRSNNRQINYNSINIKVERCDFLSGSDIRKREGKLSVKRGGHSSSKLDKSSALIGHTTVTHTHTANRSALNATCGLVGRARHYFRSITLPLLCSKVRTISNSVWQLEP